MYKGRALVWKTRKPSLKLKCELPKVHGLEDPVTVKKDPDQPLVEVGESDDGAVDSDGITTQRKLAEPEGSEREGL